MNIGQLPAIFIWPYALVLLLMGRSIWFMLDVLSEEQRKLVELFVYVRDNMEETILNSLEVWQNSFEGDGYDGDLFYFTISALKLYFGSIFLLILKLYLWWRHVNYLLFAIIFYTSRFLERNIIRDR